MVAAFKANDNEHDIAESDTESIKLEMSEELFPDQGEELFEGASSEVDNIDTSEKDLHEAFVG